MHRYRKIEATERRLTGGRLSLADFASGHEFFGLHRRGPRWVFREWAPNAEAVFLVGDFSGWKELPEFELRRTDPRGVWEIRLPGSRLHHGDLYRLKLYWPGGSGDRIPAWCRRVVQDPATLIFNAQLWRPPQPYRWRHPRWRRPKTPPLVYEVHPGMAQEEEKVGTWAEFTEKVLPRIRRTGYNTIQLMAVQEHPYYASFGYQVSSFFAASSR